MKISDVFLNSSIPIGFENSIKQINWAGTGFLVVDQSTGNDLYYVVTNKHVVAGKNETILRFTQNNGSVTEQKISLQNGTKSLWTGHSNAEVDLAIIPIELSFLQNHDIAIHAINTTTDCLTKQLIIDKAIGEGSEVYALGYPMGLVGANSTFPFVRKGVISKIRHFISQSNSDFVVDISNFPGNSGGPVILEILTVNPVKGELNPLFYLIGIIKSYIPFQDIAISSLTNKARIVFEENSGLANVEFVDRISETITEHLKK